MTHPLLLAAFLCFGITQGALLKYPLHASCKIKWTFELSCKDTAAKIVDQMGKWTNNTCGSGEKCGYKLLSNDGTTVKATHSTPVKHYIDDLEFVFGVDGSHCKVNGASSSETWYAYLDYSTNYCNLHNLITGSGLDKDTSYTESTSDSVCTQYSSAKCEKY